MASGRFSTDPIPAGTRIACRVEYDGGRYCGWQSQPGDVATVQDSLETALSAVAAQPVRTHCAGRTDTGVHAHAQIIHFHAPATRSAKAWVVGGNANLPRDVRLHWAHPVADDFHARFSATARRYRYLIANALVRPALLHGRAAWHRPPLNESAMAEGAACLLGEQDFSALRAAACQSHSPWREVQAVQVWRRAELVVIDIRANAFLHHMVRNIAGVLLAVGDGRRDPAWVARLLASRDRTLGADTAPACGLYLVDVSYPGSYGLPQTPYGPALVGPPPTA